ncbi:DUF3575 domain-containing protein [Phocaeicola sp. HCN-40430]|uniref:DUF3575 domain-containing protein n=1 Tax=Phocaeicola sp. HCN-40430 TaxID=3134664 RepID=UPI0030C1C1A2
MTTKQTIQVSNKILFLFLFVVMLLGGTKEAFSQHIVVKTNGLSWLMLAPNIEGEIKLSEKMTGSLSLNYKPWHVLSDNRKVMGICIQPELRYWFCQTYYQHFMGVHLNYADYNAGLKKKRYQGNLYGVGLTYGYQMILSDRWNLEFSVGAGYARMNHDVYDRPKCGAFLGAEKKNYFGLTKLGVSLVYIIK